MDISIFCASSPVMGKCAFNPITSWIVRFTYICWFLAVTPEPTCADELINDGGLFAQLKIVVSKKNSGERQMALIRINNQELYRTLARSDSDLELAYLATALLTSQDDLREQAVAPHALIRLVAVTCITDETFLLSRILGRDEPSPTVRRAIVATLRKPELLAEAAQEAYYNDVRLSAAQRVMDPELAAKVRAAKAAIEGRVAEIKRLTSPEDLIPYLTTKKYDVMAIAAAKGLQKQESLASAAMLKCDYPVEKIILEKLTDHTLLMKVAAEAADPAMRFAAKAKVDFHVLEESIKKTTGALASIDNPYVYERVAMIRKKGLENEIIELADIAGALALLVDSLGLDHRQVKSVFSQLIGYEYRIVEVADLIRVYGDTDSIHTCLLSGQPDLEDMAYKWYKDHFYDLKTLDGPLPIRR